MSKKIDPKLVQELRQRSGSGFLDCKLALEACDSDVPAAAAWLIEHGKAQAARRSQRVALEGVIQTRILADGSSLIYELNCETDFVAKNADFLALARTIGDHLADGLLPDDPQLTELMDTFSARSGERIMLRRVDRITTDKREFSAEYTHTNRQFGVILTVSLGGGEVTKEMRLVARGVAMHAGALNPPHLRREDVDEALRSQIQASAESSPALAGKPENIRTRIIDGILTKSYSEYVLLDQPLAMDATMTVGEYLKRYNLTLVSLIRYEVGEGIERSVSDFAEEVRKQMG